MQAKIQLASDYNSSNKDASRELADEFWTKAQNLKQQRQYLEAARMYEKSAYSEIKSPKPRISDLREELNAAGFMYYQANQYDKAIPHYREAIACYRTNLQGDLHRTVTTFRCQHDHRCLDVQIENIMRT